jgi:hypothetical protein
MGIQNKKILASILFVLISFVCMAQGPCGGCSGGPGGCAPCCAAPGGCGGPPPPPGLPIDGALPILLAAGIFYGIKNKLK